MNWAACSTWLTCESVATFYASYYTSQVHTSVFRMPGMRVFAGLIAVACLFLAGCTPSGDETPTETPTDDPTETTPTLNPTTTTLTSVDEILVSGDFGTQTSVTAPYPFEVEETICDARIPGTGATVGEHSVVELQYTGINATTGQTFDSSFFNQAPLLGQNGYFVEGFNNCLTDSKAGSRVLMAISGPDGYDEGGGNPDAGINVGDTLLFVVDIVAVEYEGPEGQHLADGNQWVTVTDEDGVPTATIKTGVPAPTTLQVTVLTQGTGRTVEASDAVYVNFLQMDYATGKTIENSFTDGGGPQADMLANLIPGWRNALVNQPMGSRLLIIVPGDLAYPQGNESPAVAPNATLVFVVDILFSFVPQSQ